MSENNISNDTAWQKDALKSWSPSIYGIKPTASGQAIETALAGKSTAQALKFIKKHLRPKDRTLRLLPRVSVIETGETTIFDAMLEADAKTRTKPARLEL